MFLPTLLLLVAVGLMIWSSGRRRSGSLGPAPAISPETLFRTRILPLWCEVRASECGNTNFRRFQAEAVGHFREARLLALAYPGEMEPPLVSMALDTSLEFRTRACAVALLGELLKVGRLSCEKTLLELAKGSDAMSGWALSVLSENDRAGKYVDLNLDHCRRGVLPAFDAVSYWNREAITQEMRRIIAANPGNSFPQSTMRLSAVETLARLEILASPDAERKLEAILDGTEDFGSLFPWALRVGRLTSLPAFLPALRRRLNASEFKLEDLEAALQEQKPSMIVRVATIGSSEDLDLTFDDALVAYWEAGGKPKESERMRLYAAGYGCDPKLRLEELLPTGR